MVHIAAKPKEKETDVFSDSQLAKVFEKHSVVAPAHSVKFIIASQNRALTIADGLNIGNYTSVKNITVYDFGAKAIGRYELFYTNYNSYDKLNPTPSPSNAIWIEYDQFSDDDKLHYHAAKHKVDAYYSLGKGNTP